MKHNGLSNSLSVKIEICNSLWQKTRTLTNEMMAPGNHEVEFPSESLPGGIYFFRMEASGYRDTQKMVLLKQ